MAPGIAPLPALLGCALAIGAAAYLLGRYGAAQDLAGQRVLFQLDPFFAAARTQAAALQVFLYEHLRELGGALSAWLVAVAALAHWSAGRRAWPVSLAAAAVVAASWGEILIFQGVAARGAPLLAAGFALALILGVMLPMERIAGFPPAPSAAPDAPAAMSGREIAALLALLVASLVARTYALNELPSGFDGEALNDMVMSRTAHGLREFLAYNFIANATGALQMLAQFASYQLFGTSIFALRYSVAVLGTLVVLLFYALVRRGAGARPALLAGVLAALAPEQLYWSRFEVTHFLVAVCAGLVTLHLCHSLVRRLSPLWTLAAALWMPFSRLLYIAGWVLVALPPLAAFHSLLLGRTRRLKALYVLPLLALGVVLWGATPSLLRWTFVDPWLPFVPPANVYGHSFVTQSGQLQEPDTLALALKQLEAIAAHAADVAVYFFDRCDRFTHWYIRAGVPPVHITVTNAALAVWAFCGLFYLLGQWRDPRAVALLALFAVGLAPSLMSPIPFARRMLLIFIALPIAAALFASAAARAAAAAGAAAAATLLRATAAVAGLLVALTSAQSYFALPMGKGTLLEQIRFTRPLFAADDAIFHNLSFGDEGNPGLGVAFGNLDVLVRRELDFQYVEPQRWLAAALRLQPHYEGYLARITMAEPRRAALAATRRVERASFLLHDLPASAAALRLLGELYPRAQRRVGAELVALSISAADTAERRTPRIRSGAAHAAAGAPLLGFPAGPAASPDAATQVAAGVLIEADDWYRWRLEPPCADAALSIDAQRVAWSESSPLLRGVHALALELPGTCRVPVALTRLAGGAEEAPPLAAGDLFAPEIAALPSAQPRPAELYDGFADARLLTEIAEPVVDFALAPDGGMSLLARAGAGWEVQRLDAAGVRRSAWPLEGDEPVFALAVAADGTHAILSEQWLRLYTAAGRQIAQAALQGGPACDVVFWGRDRVLINHPGRDSILVLDGAGRMYRELKSWPGQDAPLYAPWSLSADGQGRLLVRDSSRRAFVVSSPLAEFVPRTEHTFAVDALEHGAAFAAGDRIVIPAERGFQVFRADGTRLVARDRARDLSDERFGRYPRAHSVGAGNVLYALDTEAHRLWRIDW